MDLRKIKKLIDLLEESNLAEIEIREGEESVRLSRLSRSAPVLPVQAAPMAVAAPVVATAPPAVAPVVDTAAKAGRDLPEGHVVRSPMVGTFYASPSRHLLCVAESRCARLCESWTDRQGRRDARHHRSHEDVQSH